MNSKTFCYLTCSAMLVGLFLSGVIAVSYGQPVPATPCLKSRSIPIPVALPCMTPSVTPMKPTSGLASWYSRASCRREGTGGKRILMANGQPLNDKAMTCAMWIVGKNGRPLRPDGRLVKITNAQTSREVVVAWQDNGPGSVPRSRGVIADLTPAAFKALGNLRDGKIEVTVEAL